MATVVPSGSLADSCNRSCHTSSYSGSLFRSRQLNESLARSRQGNDAPDDDDHAAHLVEAKANRSAYAAVCTAMFGAIMFGLDQGNFGNVQGFDDFLADWCHGTYDIGNPEACLNLHSKDHGVSLNRAWRLDFILWGGSLITIGAALGGLTVGPFLANKLGRRLCISTGSATCFVGCLLASYLSFRREALFMIGRFVTGFGVGVCCYALPMYNAEVSVPSARGAMGSMFQLNVAVGTMIAAIFTVFVKDWKVGMMLPGAAGVIVAVVIWITPESPRYVFTKHGYEAGVKALQRVRAGDVQFEAVAISAQMAEESGVSSLSYRDMFTLPGLRRRVFIACYLQVAQQLTGVNAFLSYANDIFSGIGITNPVVFDSIWNGVMVVGCIVGLLLIDSEKGGRRIQLLGATILMGPPLVIAGLCLKYDWPGIITMIMVCIYGFGFQLAWGMIPWVYPSEIFTMAEKERAISLAVFFQYALNAGVNMVAPVLMAWSTSNTFFTFGVLNCTNIVFVYFCIKETKGVPVEDVPALFAQARDAPTMNGERVEDGQ